MTITGYQETNQYYQMQESNNNHEPITLEMIEFVQSQETITSAQLQIKFFLGYQKANRIIKGLLEMGHIESADLKWQPYIVNKF